MSGNRVLIYDIETEGLNPWEDDLFCIGVKDVQNNRTFVIREETERETVRKFISFVSRRNFDTVVGYNIGFDDRFVFAKCLKYNIQTNGFFQVYETDRIDLMDKMQLPYKSYSTNDSGSLDDWTEFLFGEEKSEDNSDIPAMIDNGDYRTVEDYCEKDVELTYRLWKRVSSVLG